MAFAALYDANVLIPHEVRDALMISASTRLHAVYWSEDIFTEWLRNSVEQKLATKESVLRFQAIMNEMFADALLLREGYEHRIDEMTNDQKDRHVLAAAVVAEADVIVTYNVDDFPKDSVEEHGIEVQTPDQFIRIQAGLGPRPFIEAFLRRAAQRNRLSIERGHDPLEPEDIAMFLRDGPARMPEAGQYLLELLRQVR